MILEYKLNIENRKITKSNENAAGNFALHFVDHVHSDIKI